MWKYTSDKGQSLLEVIVAMAIFSMIAVVMVSMASGSFVSLIKSREHTEAAALAQEGMEAVRSIRDGAWNELEFDQSGVSANSGEWAFMGEGSAETIGQYTRTITFDDVCRDGVGNVEDPCAGSPPDVHSKKVTARVDWTTGSDIPNTVKRTAYITNWDSRDWTQTDWSGGAGQAIWSDPSRFDSSVNIDVSTFGEVQLTEVESTWVKGGGEEALDDTDADFGAGVLNDTVIVGSGVPASVVLDQELAWSGHADSGSVTTRSLHDLYALSATDIWAVGDAGTVLHYAGSGWVVVSSPTTAALHSIFMISPSNGWAVGDNGTIIRWNGVNWSSVVSPVSTHLYSIFMVSANDGWAVGRTGKILRWNGVSWSEARETGSHTWNALSMISSNNGWLAGTSGKIYRYNGVDWTEFQDTGNQTWNSLFMVSFTNGWVIGNGGNIRRFNGIRWVSVSSPVGTNLQSVFMVNANDGWAVGNAGEILRWDGISWQRFHNVGSIQLNSVFMASAFEGWTVGAGGTIFRYKGSGTFHSRIFDSGDAGTVWNAVYWTESLPVGSDITIATRTGNTPIPDGTWSAFSGELTDSVVSDITSPNGRYIQYRATFTRGTAGGETPQLADITIVYNAPTSRNLNDIYLISQNDVWAVGDNGTIIHYGGSVWLPVVSPTSQNLRGVFFVDPGEGWAVGDNGTIIHYESGSWFSVPSPTARDLHDIYMVNASDGWIVGNVGEMLRWNGSQWLSVSSPTTSRLLSVYMLSASEGWAAGENGGILFWNGVSWIVFQGTGSHIWESLYTVSSSDGWLVGSGGWIYRFNGSAWTAFDNKIVSPLNAVFMTAADRGWIVGAGGNIFRWNGALWESELSSTDRILNAVSMFSAVEGWAVGDRGTILHYTRNSTYAPFGVLVSSAFPLGDPSPLQVIEWDESVPLCSPSCGMLFQIRAAPDNAGTPGLWTAWYGVTGPATVFIETNGSLIPKELNGNEWAQYRTILIGDGLNTPILYEVRVHYK